MEQEKGDVLRMADYIDSMEMQLGTVLKEMCIRDRIMCPICGNKTRDKIREDTELKNFPLYCPKCKQESLIDAKNLQITRCV